MVDSGSGCRKLSDQDCAVEMGELEDVEFMRRAVVLCSGWPSVAFVLEAMGFYVTVFSDEHELGVKIGRKWNDVSQFDPNMYTSEEIPSVWVQGSKEYVEEQMGMLSNEWKIKIGMWPVIGRKCVSLDDGNLVGCTVSHAQMGGITLGRFRIVMPKLASCSNITRGSMVRRKLRHILDHTIRGFPQGEVRDKGEEGKLKRKVERQYSGDSRVAPGIRQVITTTHCVAQKGVRIKRYLALEELLNLYDVQGRLQKIITSLDKRGQDLILDQLVKAVPEKITYSVAREIIRSCLKESRNNLEKPLQWLRYSEDGWDEEKVVRNDDALIHSGHWDQFTLKTYEPDLQLSYLEQTRHFNTKWRMHKYVEAKICKGVDVTQAHKKIFDWLRDRMLAHFRRSVTMSFVGYLRGTYVQWLISKPRNVMADVEWLRQKLKERRKKSGRKKEEDWELLERTLEQGLQAITRATKSNYWDWEGGSSLFFWRWPDTFVEEARDGTAPFVTGKFPRYRAGQQWPRDRTVRKAMEEKWMKIILRGYVSTGPVVSLTGSFPVPKGDNDIRMVYDATKCGLNSALWAPNFFLPTIDTTLWHADECSWFGDIDLGEQFLNFSLHHSLRQYAGIDVSGLREVFKKDDTLFWKGKGRKFLRWERCLMGLRSSPYNAVRATSWAEDIIKGDPLEKRNIFRWDRFKLNLPGSSKYDPSMPQGYKWDDFDQGLANNFETYVDDIRSSGRSEILCARASRRIASIFNFLGIQDAARKRRFPPKIPGVWCGERTVADSSGLYTGTRQKKWDRGKLIEREWLKELLSTGELDRKDMLKGRGYLVHLSRTYPGITPFLKGESITLLKVGEGEEHRWMEIH